MTSLDPFIFQASREEAMMTQDPSKPKVMESFASLLSTALTSNGVTPASLTDAAKNLPRLISASVSDDTNCCIIPCLMLQHHDSLKQSMDSSSLVDASARYLARKLTLNRVELESLPLALLENLSESFMSLFEARLRTKISISLAAQHEAQQPSDLTTVVVGLLTATPNPISPTAVVTSFRVLPVSDRARNGDHVAPLVMETVVDLRVLDKQITATIVAPGTIQGTFGPSNSDHLLTNVEVVLDTVALLQSMMKQATIAVRQAVIIATGAASNYLAPPVNVRSLAAVEEAAKAQRASFEQAISENSTDTTMMPPPPRIPAQGQETWSSQTNGERMDCDTNPTWGENENGLSLLMAAAIRRECSEDSDHETRRRQIRHPPTVVE